MTFVTSWRQSYWKFRFHHFWMKYNSKMFCPKFSEAIKLSNQAMFWRHIWQQEGSGVSKFCNAIMAKWVLSWLCINTMFIEMYRSHWLKKHLLLNEGFNNYTNKICLLSVKSMIIMVRYLSCEFLWFDYMVERSLLDVPNADNIARNFAEECKVHFSTKAKMTCLKELPESDLQFQTMHSLTPKWDDVQ